MSSRRVPIHSPAKTGTNRKTITAITKPVTDAL